MCSSYSFLYSKISPGCQSRASQIVSNVLNRIALAFPVFKMDRLAGVIPSIFTNSFD